MAVSNSIVPQNNEHNEKLAEFKEKVVEFMVGDEIVQLTINKVRAFLVRGKANLVTDQEITLFINLCRYRHLNPWLNDAFLIKYSEKSPATMVVGKDAKLKRAKAAPEYAGHEAGVVVLSKEGELIQRTGALTLPGESLVGGWAKVYVKGYDVPIETVAAYNEYVAKDIYGNVNTQWSTKPCTMIRKVALSQALTEAFPNELTGMYEAEETRIDPEIIGEPPAVIDTPEEESTLCEYTEEMPAEPEQVIMEELPGGF